MTDQELKDVMEKIEQCQEAAESLLQCVQNFGRIIIVTLSTRGILEKRCQIWYPRLWELLKNSKITIIYAKEVHKALLQKGGGDKSKFLNAPTASQQHGSQYSSGYWAWVKGQAIAQELNRFYSQYAGQTWKNIVCIGDSDFERYGMLGAANAYVQTRFSSMDIKESSAYVQGWEFFDNDPGWGEKFEGVHEGHVFKVRIKVLKLLADPTPADLSNQLMLILQLIPPVVVFDGCLNIVIDDLKEKTLKSLASLLPLPDELLAFKCSSPEQPATLSKCVSAPDVTDEHPMFEVVITEKGRVYSM
jgi:hypothetical protein